MDGANGIETAATAPKASNPWAVSVRLKHYNADRTRFQIDHDLRRGKQPTYVDAERSPLNSVMAGPEVADYRALMLERRALTNPKRAPMLDRVAIMTGGIVTFGHLAQLRILELSHEQQDAMFREIAEAVAERLGNEMTGGAVHRDEESPHAHFQMPARRPGDGKLMSEVLKPSITSELQDLAATVAQRYAPEIQRGEKKANTKARNKSVKQLHRTRAVDQAKKEERIAALDAEIAAKAQELEAADAKRAKNERLAEKARLKAESEGARAEKAAQNAETYQRRADAARKQMDRLGDEIDQTQWAIDDLRRKAEARKSQLADLDATLAQKKTRIASLAARKVALQARLQSLSVT